MRTRAELYDYISIYVNISTNNYMFYCGFIVDIVTFLMCSITKKNYITVSLEI